MCLLGFHTITFPNIIGALSEIAQIEVKLKGVIAKTQTLQEVCVPFYSKYQKKIQVVLYIVVSCTGH